MIEEAGFRLKFLPLKITLSKQYIGNLNNLIINHFIIKHVSTFRVASKYNKLYLYKGSVQRSFEEKKIYYHNLFRIRFVCECDFEFYIYEDGWFYFFFNSGRKWPMYVPIPLSLAALGA